MIKKINKFYLLALPMTLFLGNSNATVFQPLIDDIQEPAGIYYLDQPNVLKVDLQTRIGTGPCVVGNYSGCTLDDLHSDIDPGDDFKPEIKAYFTADDFPDNGKNSNATLRLRGASSRLEGLKSYRIKIDSKKDLWRGERRLQANKHTSDLTRVRNKLSFDLMTSIPHLPSLRTQFVNLFIDGIDYGFYTHVEHVGKEYLLRRNWDKDSGVYKAENFDFTMQNELLLDDQGKPLDLDAFETVLEIKRGDDSRALLEMIKAVNDKSNNFKTDVMDKYFNLNNFLTWEAVNILMGNTDVTTYNYYLFNPKGTDKFYFLPWDFDSTWGYDWQPVTVAGKFIPAKRYQGPHNLWATAFGRRFLSQPGALELLNSAVREIKEKYLMPERVRSYSDSYYNLVFPFVSRDPDIGYLATQQPTSSEMFDEYNEVYEGLVDAVQMNYDRFLKAQHSPMPFHLDTVYLDETNVVFTWEAAVDLQGDNVTYDLEISDNPEFESADIKFNIKGLKSTTYSSQWMLPRGDYYYRVTARDVSNPAENWQLGFEEYYVEETSFTAYGVVPFTVDFDGEPHEPAIIIDGWQDDWSSLVFWMDPDDIIPKKTVDWRKAWFTQDNNNIYIAYLNDTRIIKRKHWAWHVYIDTDNSADTGYQMESIGMDYLLEGSFLWKYMGDGESWLWQRVTEVEHVINGKFAEFSIPKKILQSPSGYNLLFYGANGYMNDISPADIMLITE